MAIAEPFWMQGPAQVTCLWSRPNFGPLVELETELDGKSFLFFFQSTPNIYCIALKIQGIDLWGWCGHRITGQTHLQDCSWPATVACRGSPAEGQWSIACHSQMVNAYAWSQRAGVAVGRQSQMAERRAHCESCCRGRCYEKFGDLIGTTRDLEKWNSAPWMSLRMWILQPLWILQMCRGGHPPFWRRGLGCSGRCCKSSWGLYSDSTLIASPGCQARI